MSVLLLTGPPASGKNTVGEQLAKKLEFCAVINTDVLRHMVLQPRKLAWEGKEGHRQHVLGIDNCSAITRNFHEAGYDVVIGDTLTDATLAQYRRALDGIDLWTVLILPSQEEIARRLLSRPDYLSRGQVEQAYVQQAKFEGYDERLDNTDMSIDEAVDWILQRWPRKS